MCIVLRKSNVNNTMNNKNNPFTTHKLVIAGKSPVMFSTVCLGMRSQIRDRRARCSSVVRVFAHGAMGRGIDPSWGEPIELFLFPASAPRLV